MNSRRVAVLGKSRSILTWFEDTLDGFRRQGCEVAGISFQADTPAERLSQKRGAGKELQNQEVIRRTSDELAAFSPDLVVVLNKAGLPEPTVEAWQKGLRPGVPVVGWLCDCINQVPQQQVPAFEGVYYFDSHCLPILEEFYAGRVPSARLDYLPLAVNPDRYPFHVETSRRDRLVFAGKCSPHRHEAFAQMRATGLPLDLYGPGSRNRLKFWRNRRLSSAAIAELYRSYIAVLNLPQPGNTERGLNLRAFEIPAAGGIGTYPDVPDLPLCFVPGEEILVYRSPSDLAAQIAELKKNPARAEQIIRAGHARILKDHTFECRAAKVLSDWL